MTNEEAKIYLRNWRNAIESRGDTDFSDAMQTLNIAISALESIGKITAERDALLTDLKSSGDICQFCKHDANSKVCMRCEYDDIKWEWRGAQNKC